MDLNQNSPSLGGKFSFKNALPDVVVILAFLLVSMAYFLTPMSEGLVLGGHDSVASVGLGQEQKQYREQHNGDVTRWSNAIFSGMPTYQTAPSYSATDTVSFLSEIYGLGTGKLFPAVSYLFLYLLGFYVMLRAFNFKPYLAALGSVLWAFSSYFLIIIAAGHIWKVMTLAFIPPTIGGLVLCYRGKYLWGCVVTALFTAFQVVSNHMQMTYYFLFVMLFLVVAYFVDALRKRTFLKWAKATGVLIVAGLLGVAANLPNLYHTYQYANESMRGKAELTPEKSAGAQAQQATNGLDRDYITMWSYGVDETLTLLIPDYKGGGSASMLDREGVEDMEGYDDFYQSAGQTQQAFQQANIQAQLPGLSQYWGDQPFTVGPVYIGAFVCFLFILGLFYVKGPVKWGLLAATVLSLIFAWGKNIPEVTNFIIDHMPLYSKFRTVSSALVIAEFTMPLLAVLCVYEITRRPELFQLQSWKSAPLRKKVGLPVATVFTLGLCLLFAVAPGAAGNCISQADMETFSMMQKAGFPAELVGTYMHAITSIHHAILSGDALRSAFIIVLGILVLWAYAAGKLRGWLCCTFLAVICLVDLWQIDKRYLNNDSFTEESQMQEAFAPTAADNVVLQDKSYYRVANLSGGNPFNETSNATSYYHHSIGGYHAAKLHRYQDLIDRQLSSEIPAFANAANAAEGDLSRVNGDSITPVLNMLNTKYFLFGKEANQVVQNPYANGNAWFVQNLAFVKNADDEMAALTGLDTKHKAVADQRFKTQLDGSPLDSGKVTLTAYAPNQLQYDVTSAQGGVVVFSEIYYPGWTVTIDGQPAELGRVNYVLRALKVPAGQHKVDMSFKPKSITRTNIVAYVALALIFVCFVLAIVVEVRKRTGRKNGAD